MKNYPIQLTVILILITSLLFGCAAIPGGNVKLNEIPKVKNNNINSLNLSYYFEKTEKCEEGLECNFNRSFVNLLKSKNYKIEPSNLNNISGCAVKISSKNDVKGTILAPYAWVSGLTLFVIPFYVPLDYQAQASLVYYPSQSSLKNKAVKISPHQINFSSNKIKVKNTKEGNYLLTPDNNKINEGEYFFDEDNRLTKLLKTYYFKDKVHEVWSSLWMLSWFVVKPSIYAPSAEYPEDAKKIVENNISEALVRSVLNDAAQFPECQKDGVGKNRD